MNRTAQSMLLGLLISLLAIPAIAQEPQRDPPQRRSRRPARQQADDKAPRVGQMAPDFRLKSLDGKSETRLSQFRGKKPVVLFFGSYT